MMNELIVTLAQGGSGPARKRAKRAAKKTGKKAPKKAEKEAVEPSAQEEPDGSAQC